MKFSGKVGNGPMNKWLHFGGDLAHHLDTGIFFWICHYWEIRKVVNRQICCSYRFARSFVLVKRALAEVSSASSWFPWGVWFPTFASSGGEGTWCDSDCVIGDRASVEDVDGSDWLWHRPSVRLHSQGLGRWGRHSCLAGMYSRSSYSKQHLVM